MHVYTHIYVCVYVYIYIYKNNVYAHGFPQKPGISQAHWGFFPISVVIQEANAFALKSLAVPNWPFSFTLSPLGKFLVGKDGTLRERSTDSVFKVKTKKKDRTIFQVHILFIIYVQPSCFTTIAASYLHWGEGGGKRWERISKKRKENESCNIISH